MEISIFYWGAQLKHRLFNPYKLFKIYEEEFFHKVVIGSTYRYSDGDYLYEDVQNAAKKYGVSIRYNDPDTLLYKLRGCCNFTVTAILEQIQEQKPLYFDINELAI